MINSRFIFVSQFKKYHSFGYTSGDNTISVAENTIKKLIHVLEREIQAAIERFKHNEMILSLENQI